MTRPQRLTIGTREVATLPDWGIKRVLAKTDTGAASSAIDVVHHSIEELPADDDAPLGRVRFAVVAARKRVSGKRRVVRVEAPIARRGPVTSSNGQTHDRLFVQTVLRVGAFEKTIELGLVDRQKMTCRMLLGLSTLAPDLLVDPSAEFLLTEKPGKKKRTEPT
ncbi:MAG: RimK/LysX family protein [Planctomycetota bacterium]